MAQQEQLNRTGFSDMKILLCILLCIPALVASDERISAITYLTVNSGDVVYVPTWGLKDVNGNYNIPSGKEILYNRLNTSTNYYELWYCGGAPGVAAANVCTGQTCISCVAGFKTAVWGGNTRSVGRAMWSRDGNYVVFSAQDGVSTIPGFGVPAAGVCTADPGIGCDHHIWVMDKTFANFWQIDSATCATKCAGDRPGFAANGTRAVPITGAYGGWFPAFSADGTSIAWSNNTCVQTIDGTANCTGIVLGTELERVIWSPGGGFPGTATVSFAQQITFPHGGGMTCDATSCTLTQPQYFYEMHDFHPTDSTIFYMSMANLIQTGNVSEITLTGAGSVRIFMSVCTAGFLDPYICHWTEHHALSPDGTHLAVATTIDTGPTQGQPTASPVFSPATYPPMQEVDFVDPRNANGVGRVRLTFFNTVGNPEFINTTCHVRFATLVFSPDNKYILANNIETNQAGNKCPGGHGTYGFVFTVMTLSPRLEFRGGAALANGALVTMQ